MKISFPAPTSRLTTVLCALLLHVLSSSSSLQLPSPSQSQSQSQSSSSPGVVFSAAYDKSRADFFNGNSTYAKLVRLATADRRSKRTKRRQEQRRRKEGHETGGAEEGGGGGGGGGGGTVVVGDREAQWKLGAMLVRGRVVERNMVEAEQWWRLAAEQGHPEAQYQLAHLYHLNRGHMTR